MRFFEMMQEINIVSTTAKLLLALLCGGILGIERERNRHPAGLRTYMLVCIGSTLVMITNEYVSMKFSGIDPARMGAQVISGIGFLGAGTIIVTGQNRIRGLTTAAGLWAAACIGLTIGAGFYSGAIIGSLLILIVMSFMNRMDKRINHSVKSVFVYAELMDVSYIGKFILYMKSQQVKVMDIEVTKSRDITERSVAVIFTAYSKIKHPREWYIDVISGAEGVIFAEET